MSNNNNPFAKADSSDTSTPNNLGGSYVLAGTGNFKVTDVKLVDNDREGTMYHIWELETLQHDNPEQQKVCAVVCKIHPDPYNYGIKDSKAMAAAALGCPFEEIDSALLNSSTTKEGKEAFVGAEVKIEAVQFTTKKGKEATKYKFEHAA